MDKAVIVGVFEFLGFHFCQNLLNKGLEVDGLHIGRYEEGFFLEEKRMEIVRNANFKEYVFQDYQWPADNRVEKVIIVDYYDLFMRKKEEDFFALQPIKALLSYLKTSKDMVIFLLPVKLLSEKGFEKERLKVERLLGLLKRGSGYIKKFYLPTVFGPWQPEEFSFQQHFLRGEGNNRIRVNERECLSDAIFVEETLQTILHYCRKEDDEFLLTSGKKNQWETCANYLSLPIIERTTEILKCKTPNVTIPVRKNTSIEMALAQQQHHTDRLKSLY